MKPVFLQTLLIIPRKDFQDQIRKRTVNIWSNDSPVSFNDLDLTVFQTKCGPRSPTRSSSGFQNNQIFFVSGSIWSMLQVCRGVENIFLKLCIGLLNTTLEYLFNSEFQLLFFCMYIFMSIYEIRSMFRINFQYFRSHHH